VDNNDREIKGYLRLTRRSSELVGNLSTLLLLGYVIDTGIGMISIVIE